MRFSTLYGSPQGCTCYDNKNSQCAPNYWCNECRNNPSNPNCNMRVGNQVVPRYQTQSGSGGIYATPTNRFRNVVEFMPMGTENGGFSMPMGISERANFQNANGSAEEIFGKQENPTRGLYAIEINSTKQIVSDKLLYNVLINAMKNKGLPIPMFSPKLVNKGYRRGNYYYLFEIRDGFRASNFVQESRLQNEAPSVYSFKNNFGKEVAIFYTATFISGYLYSPKFQKGGGGRPIGGGGFNSAVGMGNPTMVAPAFGGTKIPSADVNSNRCMKACNKNQLQGVFINGKCYCSTHKQFAEWKEKNFSNAIGGCNWLFCPEGYTKRGCRCVPNEHLPKRVKKKMNLDFSNFINNPFAKARKTEMSDAKCRRICDRSKHTAILVDGNCICASINDIADFQKDKGYHNAVGRRCQNACNRKGLTATLVNGQCVCVSMNDIANSQKEKGFFNAVDRKRGCEEQVTCPNGFIAKVVGVNCMCVPVDKPSAISPANRVVNRR